MDWNELLSSLLYAAITSILPVLTYYLLKFLRAQFDKLSVETENTMFNDTVNRTLDMVISVVSSTSQTYVDALKKEGKFDLESQKIAFNMTKDTILSLLSSETKEILNTLYGDLDEWITVQIESTVKRLK